VSYVALDRAIWTSTVLKEGPVVVATWLLLLADADRYGETRATPSSIASVLRVDDAAVEKAFKVLASPDPKSRNKEHAGRRMIDKGNGLWQLVSYPIYKEMATKASAVDRQQRYEQRIAASPWSHEACDDWNTRFGEGTAPGGRIGKALKPLVTKHTWETVRPAWRRYLTEKDADFITPQDFASKFNIWLQGNAKLTKVQQMTLLGDAWQKWRAEQ
jgi:hypothetical protein